MRYAEQIIVNDVIAHMGQYGGKYQDWYVGVAADAKATLFTDHGVKESGDAWICRQCANADLAREIERCFMKKGCQGGAAGEGQSTRYFYAYKMEPHTRP